MRDVTKKSIGIAVSPELPVKVSAILLAIFCLKSIADSDSDTSKVSAIVSLAIAIIDINYSPANIDNNNYVIGPQAYAMPTYNVLIEL